MQHQIDFPFEKSKLQHGLTYFLNWATCTRREDVDAVLFKHHFSFTGFLVLTDIFFHPWEYMHNFLY